MVKSKNYLLNPISRQNFANAFAVNHNLKLEVCHNVLDQFLYMAIGTISTGGKDPAGRPMGSVIASTRGNFQRLELK